MACGWLPYSNAVHYTERREQFRHLVVTGILPDGYATDAGAGLIYQGTELLEAICDRPNAPSLGRSTRP